MRRPNFLYIGPPKAGSTWLHEALSRHPQVYLTPAKELQYFDRFYHRGERWYLKHFKGAKATHSVVGEISHDYLYSADACHRIASDLGQIPLMVCLREPVDRAFSDYLYMLKQGYVRGDFEDAVERHPEILEHSKYAKYLSRYLAEFGRERLLLSAFDDMKTDPFAFYADVCERLEIDKLVPAGFPRGKVLPAAVPRNFILARLAKEVAMAMRDVGLTTSIARIKSRRGVQALLYRKMSDVGKPSLSPDQIKQYKRYFMDDVQRLDMQCFPGIARRWGYDVLDREKPHLR